MQVMSMRDCCPSEGHPQPQQVLKIVTEAPVDRNFQGLLNILWSFIVGNLLMMKQAILI